MSEAIIYINCLKESNQRDTLYSILIKYSTYDGEDDIALAMIQGFQFLHLTWHFENFLKGILVSCRSPNF